jgi:serine protease Do
VASVSPGSDVPVRLIRKGQEKKIQVKVDEMKEERAAAAGGGTLEESLGMTVQELTPEIARNLGLSDSKGIVVTNVEDNGAAEEAGIQRGDVIVEINQRKVESIKDYQAALGRVGGADSLLLLVRRGNNVLYVALKMAK